MDDLVKALAGALAVVTAALIAACASLWTSRRTAQVEQGKADAAIQMAVNDAFAKIMAQRDEAESNLRLEVKELKATVSGLAGDIRMLLAHLQERGIVDYPIPKHYAGLTVLSGGKEG